MHAKPAPGRRGTGRPDAMPVWRRERLARVFLQAIFLAGVALVGWFFVGNMLRELGSLGLGISFDFLRHEAGFGISEGIAYSPADSYARALAVGAYNTIRVVAAILCATVIGVAAGLARLSSNWLVRTIALVYVEVFRNVPLLLQLLFWYSAVLLKLPPVRQSISYFDAVFLNQRGLYLPRPVPAESFWVWLCFVAVVAALGTAALVGRRGRAAAWGGFGGRAALILAIVLGAGVLGWAATPARPFALEMPELQRFNFSGGVQFSPEFAGLLMGLSIYTGAFIAEVVRGGVQAVDKGQREAATALGLTSFQVTRLVVMPQALRTIIPPVTSQYLNLAKNSTLAVAIGYPELFNVGTTMMSQTGHTIPVFLIITAGYLSLSLVTSAFMNWYNRRVRSVGR